ncbi:hypothetical protein DFH08DRAFT_1004424 [Mycena albidolilacea]|uniref:HIT-type domain-containing protein n=1 Tax=Mycena albidolilacea TaxID=1033008 RepID=A0AAD7ARW2_9AGAR|nr:hypothetical protein DFH08DRAFT_1004424 [Mycena albidolilacea]
MLQSTEPSPLSSPPTSLAGLPYDRLRRSRTASSLSLSSASSSRFTLDMPMKSDPSVYLTIRSGLTSTVGAFSPTPDAQTALEFFITPVRKRRPTVVPPTPQRALTIPSICRTAPALADRVPPSPSSAPLLDFDTDYATPRRASTSPIRDATPPALASLERRSRLCSPRVVCATCRTPGTNFPACPRCSAAWCSRACRLPNGARHVCSAAATPKPSPSPSRPGTGISKSPLASTPMPILLSSPR